MPSRTAAPLMVPRTRSRRGPVLRLLDHLSIRQKLLGAFAVDLALMVGLGLFAFFQMSSMARQASQVEHRTLPALRGVDTMRSLVTRYRSHQLEYLILSNDADRARLEGVMQTLEQRMHQAVSEQVPLLGSSDEEVAWRDFVAAWDRYQDANRSRYLPAVRRSNSGTVQPALSRLNPLYRDLQDAANRLADLADRQASEAAGAVQKRFRESLLFMIGDTALSLVISAAVGLALASTLSRRISALRGVSRRVAQGDLDTRDDLADVLRDARRRVQEPGSKSDTDGGSTAPYGDELSDLARQFDLMVHSLRRQRQALEERNRALEESLEVQEGLTRDLVERREAEEAAVRARVEAEAASSAKSFFLATMSHELRTPLNAILGYAQVMSLEAEVAGDMSRAGDVERILAAGRHLMTLISNVLDFSKIEQGGMDVERLDFDLGQVLHEVTALLRPDIESAGNRLRLVGAEPQGTKDFVAPMSSDPSKVRQVLFNLLSNAGKFTHGGEITVSLAGGPPEYVVSVEDTGIGIEPELLAQLFEPYRQADLSIRRRFGGTGLGLVVSRRLCRLLGGELRAESVYGEGSKFIARLPAELPPAAAPSVTASPATASPATESPAA